MTKKSKQLESVGVVIRSYRLGAGLSQEQLGHRMGVSKNYISLLECGRRYPSIGSLIRIAQGLNVPPGTMVDAIAEREAGRKR